MFSIRQFGERVHRSTKDMSYLSNSQSIPISGRFRINPLRIPVQYFHTIGAEVSFECAVCIIWVDEALRVPERKEERKAREERRREKERSRGRRNSRVVSEEGEEE